uniref:Uncharacterized protein n=1 Tax=Fagus sylvatica TaxID=28930 RepID=A0A2N9EIZ0_FAGSY
MRRRRLGGGSSTANSSICIPGTIGEGFCALPGKSHGDERERFGAAMEERRSLEAWRRGSAWLGGSDLQACGNRRLGGGSLTTNSSNLYSWDDRRGFLCFARQKPWRRGREVRSCHGGAEEAQNGTVTVKPWRVLERETENSTERK